MATVLSITRQGYKFLNVVIHSDINNSTETLLSSSNTKLMNLNDNIRVRIISATGTPIWVKGSINHRKADASCSGVVVVRQRLALWKTFHKNTGPLYSE